MKILFNYFSNTSQDFIKSYSRKSNEGCILELYVQHAEKLNKIYNDLPFLPKRLKIEKVEKLVTNLHVKTEYVECMFLSCHVPVSEWIHTL